MTVRDLEIYVDADLSMRCRVQQIVCHSLVFCLALRKLRSIRRSFPTFVFQILVVAPTSVVGTPASAASWLLPLSGLTRASAGNTVRRGRLATSSRRLHVYSTTISGNQFATSRPSSEAETVYLVRSLLAAAPGSQDFALLFIHCISDLSRLRSFFRWNVTDQKVITVTDSKHQPITISQWI